MIEQFAAINEQFAAINGKFEAINKNLEELKAKRSVLDVFVKFMSRWHVFTRLSDDGKIIVGTRSIVEAD